MNLVALMLAKNEQGFIGVSSRVALKWCDNLVVLNHASTDHTQAILDEVSEEHPGRVTVIHSNDAGWPEMHHRHRTLEAARAEGATHIAIVDADEVLVGSSVASVRSSIEKLQSGQYVFTRMHAMWRSIHQYRDDNSVWSNQKGLVFAFKDSPELCWKPRGDYQYHNRPPSGSREGHFFDGGIMHLQFSNWSRLIAKHAWYKIIERVQYPDIPISKIEAKYNKAPDEAGIRFSPAPVHWWGPHEDLHRYFEPDTQPWQAEEAKRLYIQHGPEMFRGLSLFGVV